MSMCYLCDLCANKLDVDYLNTCECMPFSREHRKKAIDYGRDDPNEICKHFELKEGGDVR